MHKLPSHIVLMGQTIPIVRAELKQAYAQFDSATMEITIDTKCPEHMIKTSLVHEMVHAVLEISGLTNLFDLSVEEAICRSMENLVDFVAFPKAKR